jgi:hypothetical protein
MRTHSLARKRKERASVVTTGFADQRWHSLRDGFNSFLRALPGDRALLPPSLARSSRKLDISVGMPGPHDFAVRVDAPRLSRSGTSTAFHASVFVTTAKRPSSIRRETARVVKVICPTWQEEISSMIPRNGIAPRLAVNHRTVRGSHIGVATLNAATLPTRDAKETTPCIGVRAFQPLPCRPRLGHVSLPTTTIYGDVAAGGKRFAKRIWQS